MQQKKNLNKYEVKNYNITHATKKYISKQSEVITKQHYHAAKQNCSNTLAQPEHEIKANIYKITAKTNEPIHMHTRTHRGQQKHINSKIQP
jgi:hypothetical protein